MTDEKKPAAKLGNLDETQMVSLGDLEELERLQLAGADRLAPPKRRNTVLLSIALGLLAAVVVAAVLAAVYLHHPAMPPAGSR